MNTTQTIQRLDGLISEVESVLRSDQLKLARFLEAITQEPDTREPHVQGFERYTGWRIAVSIDDIDDATVARPFKNFVQITRDDMNIRREDEYQAVNPYGPDDQPVKVITYTKDNEFPDIPNPLDLLRVAFYGLVRAHGEMHRGKFGAKMNNNYWAHMLKKNPRLLTVVPKTPTGRAPEDAQATPEEEAAYDRWLRWKAREWEIIANDFGELIPFPDFEKP